MVLDKFTLVASFTEYNKNYFGNILPYPEFKIRKSYLTFGYFSCDYNPDYSMYNCLLEISNRYNYTEEQLRDIMVHEMIHYYLAYTGKDIKMEHGEEFKKMANKLNRKYGLNITVTINSRLYERKPSFTLGYLFSSIFC